MADTTVQLEVEQWIRTSWMPKQFGGRFIKESISLTSGGVFNFDAVSKDRKIVATISTAGLYTARGKRGVGKIQKVRSDVYFLLLADVERRIALLTEEDMFEFWLNEASIGRVPSSIEFLHAELPLELREKLEQSKARASKEVSPRKQGAESAD